MDKTLLLNLIEREQNYFDSQESGSEEYVSSQKRLMNLKSQLTDLEKTETELETAREKLDITKAELEVTKDASVKEDKDRLIRNVLEGVKVGSGIVLPIIGLGYYGGRKRHNVHWVIKRVHTILSSKEKLKTDPKTRGYGNIASCFSHKKHIPL